MDKRIKIKFLVLGMIFLVSCTNQPPSRETMPPGATPFSQNRSSETISPTVAPSSTVTVLPSATPTVQRTSTLTLVLPTLTPLPTLPPDQADKKVQALLRENAGCRFPCWWGITPGKSTWPEASQFLSSFTKVTPHPQFDENGAPSEFVTYYITYPLENKWGNGGFTVSVEKNQIKVIFVGRDSTIYDLRLQDILSIYGPPNQIFLQTFEHVPGDAFPLTLVLYYAKQNFLANYDLIAHEENEELVSFPSNENPALYFWSADEVVTEQRVQVWTLGVDPFIPLKPLEQVTDLNITTFTENFSLNAAENNCIRTRKEFWRSGN
jgi:hypothetical protein